MVYSPTDYVWVGITFPCIAIAAVCLRFYVVKRLSRNGVGIDDWLILAALIFCIGDGANLAVAGILGIGGRDYPDQIPQGRNDIEAKSDYAQVIIEKPLYGLTKLSVLFFFRRFFKARSVFRVVNNVLIVVIILWSISYMFAEMFICGHDVWKAYTPNMHGTDNGCGDLNTLNFTYAITDTVFDIMVILLPYPFLRKLQMNKREKLGIIGIFLLGTIATAASMVRLGVIAQAFTVGYGNPGNHHKAGAAATVWSTLEGSIGVLAACLPPMGPLIRKTPGPRKLSAAVVSALSSSRRKSSAVAGMEKTDVEKSNGLLTTVDSYHTAAEPPSGRTSERTIPDPYAHLLVDERV